MSWVTALVLAPDIIPYMTSLHWCYFVDASLFQLFPVLNKGCTTGKWKGVTVAVKIVERNAETESELLQLRESLLSSSVVHPNVVRLLLPRSWNLHGTDTAQMRLFYRV